MSRLRSNCSVIWLIPNELDEVMICSAGICPKLRSSGAVTSEAITSGLAPGSCVVTWMVGKSTCGSDDTGSHRYPRMPPSMTATPSSEVAIGRWMKGAETLMGGGSWALGRRSARGIALALLAAALAAGAVRPRRRVGRDLPGVLRARHDHLRSLGEAGKAGGDHALARAQAARHHGLLVVLLGQRHRPHR